MGKSSSAVPRGTYRFWQIKGCLAGLTKFEMGPRRKIVAFVGELKPGSSKKFIFRCAGREVEGLVINYDGHLCAYVNRCRHVALSLDWVENQFFTADGRFLLCANHGALYEPRSGVCIWGPCVGASLQRVELEVKGKKVYAQCPEAVE